MAEDKHPVSLVCSLGEELDQRVELRRRRATRAHEFGVKRELAKHRERLEYLKSVARDVANEAENLLPLALEPQVIELAMFRMQINLKHLLLLWREVGGHEIFGAPQQKRSETPLQQREFLRILFFLDWRAIKLGKSRLVAK